MFWVGFTSLVGYFLVGITLIWVWSPWATIWWSLYPIIKLSNWYTQRKLGIDWLSVIEKWGQSHLPVVVTASIIYWVAVISFTLYLISTNQ